MALTKTQSKILDFLKENGPTTIYGVAKAFEVGHNTACKHLIKLKKSGKIHCSGYEKMGRVSVRLFKAGPGEDSVFPSKSKPEYCKREKKEIDQIRAEALANAQMLLSRPNTPFGWLIERSNSI